LAAVQWTRDYSSFSRQWPLCSTTLLCRHAVWPQAMSVRDTAVYNGVAPPALSKHRHEEDCDLPAMDYQSRN
jgi:hypothetical protein